MTMNGFPLSQSPRTQGFAQPTSPDDEEELFSKGFSDLAYRAFQKTHPELYGDLVSFRVLATDAPNGEGVGAFILKRGPEVLFVPSVIADNAVKPLDMMYVRSKDRFYPLTSEWIEKATSGGVSSLGQGIEPPKDLNTDVDIRNVVVPPTTGRYSYADEFDPASVRDDELLDVFRAAYANEKRAANDAPLVFPELVSRMPDTIKTAFAKWLSKRPQYFRKMAEVYGARVLRDAFAVHEAPAKTAAGLHDEVPLKHDVYLAVAGMPLQEVRKEIAPGDVPEAYKALRYHGFYIKDRRGAALNDVAVGDEETLALTAPEHPGVYRVYLADGTSAKALVVPHPVCVAPPKTDHQAMAYGAYDRKTIRDVTPPYSSGDKKYLVLLADGRGGCVSELVAEPVVADSFDEVAAMLKSMTRESPQANQHGVLISADDLTLRATEPFFADQPTSRGDMVSFGAGYNMTAVISKKMRGSKVVAPPAQNVMVFPNSYRWFPIKEDISERDLLTRPQLIGRAIEAKIEKTGAARIKVARDHDGFRVGEDRAKLSPIEAVVKVANLYGVSVPDASRIVEAVANGLAINAWATPKTAAPKGGGDEAAADPSQDPNAMTMDPNAMAAMQAPPQPTGIDLAISEKLQLIDQQQQSLDQMRQMLTELQGRAQGIDQGGGAMAAPMGAAGMMAGPAQAVMGQPAMAPVPGMSPQQAPPQGPPQGAPMEGGAPMPGGDPNAMAMQGGDPSMMQGQPPPQPVMPKEPNPALFSEQIAPQFLNQAMELDQDGVFDASAVASLANVRSIRDLLQNYTPSLDNALDRLGRTLLLLYVKSKQIRERIGEEAYTSLEQVVRDVFRMLGDAVLSLEQYGDQLLPSGARSA